MRQVAAALIASAETDPKLAINKNKIIAQAQKFTTKKQFEKAIAEYRKLLKEDPNDIRTWLKIGDIYTRMGARTEATETYLKVAEQYTKSGFHLKAIAVYKQILKLDPAMLNIHQFLASSYLNLGLNSEALIQLEQLADMYERTNRSEKLLEVLLQMGEIDPANIATRLRVAEHLAKEERSEEAVEHFETACQELKKQGRVEDFLKVADRLLYHDSTRTDLAREVASIYLENNQYKQALAKLQTCFVADPRDLDTLELLTVAFQGLHQPEKAISVFNEMALILKNSGQHEKHRQVLESILELDPKNKLALSELGQEPESNSTGEPAIATESREDALPSPAIAIAEDSLAANDGDSPQQEELSDELSQAEVEKKTQEMLAEATVLIKYGLNDRAITHLQQVFEIDPCNIDAREKLKDVLLDEGNQEGALDQLFFLAKAFRDSQPEGSVYYLHEVLRIDKANKQARQMISELGGVMPEDMDAPAQDAASEDNDLVLGTEEETAERADAEQSTIENVDELFVLDDDADDIVVEEEDENLILDGDAPALDDGGRTGLHAMVPPPKSDPPATDSEVPPHHAAVDPESGEIAVEDDTPAMNKNSWVDIMSSADIRPSQADAAAVDELDDLDDMEPIDDNIIAVSDAPPMISVVPDAPASTPGEAPASPAYDEVSLEEIEEGLDEVQFYLGQGIVSEARTILEDLQSKYPEHPQIQEKLASLEGAVDPDGLDDVDEPVLEPAPEQDEDPFAGDLDLSDDDLDVAPEATPEATGKIETSRKVALQEQISDGDFSTHYDLGIAYKDMGLFDNAIAEFQIASGDQANVALAKTMIGMCYVNLGRMDDAITVYKEGLAADTLNRQQELGLLYELGVAYQSMEQNSEALASFETIIGYDSDFADVKSRIEAIKSGKSEPSKQPLFS